jgi:hypothetical protein
MVRRGDDSQMTPPAEQGNEPSIVSVTKMTNLSWDGIGFDVVIQNPTAETLLARSTCLEGRVEQPVRGFAGMHHSITYEITLNTQILAEGNVKIEGNVSEPDEPNWVKKSEGQFTYEMSTRDGRKLWQYELRIDTLAEISAQSLTGLRVLFQRGKRTVTDEVSEGSTPAWTTFPVNINEHSLTITFVNGSSITTPIDDDFLSFIANWPD